jgi:hypothetical protein
MAVADAGIESEGAAAQFVIQGVDELAGLLGADVTAAEIGHGELAIRLAENHQIAPEGHVRGL